MRRPPAFWVDLAVKATLCGLLLFGVLRPDLPQFEGKAMTGRALTYPIPALIVPVGWWLTVAAGAAATPTRSTSCSFSRF